MGLINWIFDIYQHSQIDKAKDEARAARAEASAMRTSGGSVDAARLERALGELALATKTVQRLMVEKGLRTHEEFARKVREIDLEDGLADLSNTLPTNRRPPKGRWMTTSRVSPL
jgi:hypothetical protein